MSNGIGYGYGPPQQPAQQQWSGFAITSLVTGILGVFCVFWPVSIGFGIAALRTIPKRGQRGKGMAVAGLVLSALWLLFTVFIIVVINPFSQSTF